MRLSVRIGRNVGAVPMDIATWYKFSSFVAATFDKVEDTKYDTCEWAGIVEENVTITGTVTQLKMWELAALARLFRQEAIAVLPHTSARWLLIGADDSLKLGAVDEELSTVS